MSKWIALCAGIVWLVAAVAGYLATFDGLITEKIELTLADGTPVRGTLYGSGSSERQMLGIVVLHAMAMSHKSCGPALTTPLARQGYIVLGIDLLGHGDSGGRRPAHEFRDLETILVTMAEHPEVEAAIDFLKRHPRVDARRIALIGHSRGGWAAVNVGHGREDVGAVVAIGAAPMVCDHERPNNLLILTGNNDRLASADRAALAIEQATSGAVTEPRQRFGKFTSGTRRRWILTGAGYHLSYLVDPAVTHYVGQWLQGSFRLSKEPFSGHRLLTAIFGAMVASTAGLLLTTYSMACLARWLPCPVIMPQPANRAALVVVFAFLMTVPALAAMAGQWVEVSPVQFAPSVLLLFVGVGLACFLGRGSVSPQAISPVAALESAVLLRGAVLGMFCLALSVLVIGTSWGLTWADLAPNPRRLVLGFVLWPLLLPACFGLAWGVQYATRTTVTLRAGAILRGIIWLSVPAAVWFGQQSFVIDRWPLFIVPVWMFAASFLVPLPLWLVSDRQGMTLARAVCHAGGAAWLVACHVPFVSAS